MNSSGKRFFITLSMLIVLFTVIGGLIGKAARKDDIYRDLTNFSEVLALVEKSYVEPVNLDHLFSGAMNGLADSLYSGACYLTAKEYEKYRAEVPDDGWHTGIDIAKRMGYFVIVNPRDESPAAREGLLAGDLIKSINQIPAEKINILQAQEIFSRGKDEVSIEIFRESLRKPLTFSLTKEKNIAPSPEVRMIDKQNGLAYLRIPSLDEVSSPDIEKALEQMQAMQVTDLILDLRNLSGENLENTVAIADLFLEKGIIVKIKTRKSPEKTYRATKEQFFPQPFLYILINRGTSAGGEILAAALAENGRGMLVGEKSFGRGTIKEFVALSDGSVFYMPVGQYLTPENKEIEGNGLEPELTFNRADLIEDQESINNTELLKLELDKIIEQIIETREEEKAA